MFVCLLDGATEVQEQVDQVPLSDLDSAQQRREWLEINTM